MAFRLTVNGETKPVEADGDTPLLWALRDHLGVLGPKFGCGHGVCGACTVHLDGTPARSCQIALESVGAAKVTTIEGIGASPLGRRVQQAWIDLDVAQCGYCQPGQIMSAVALLTETANPEDADIDAAMSGNLCRCATYLRIRAAIKRAAGQGSAA